GGVDARVGRRAKRTANEDLATRVDPDAGAASEVRDREATNPDADVERDRPRGGHRLTLVQAGHLSVFDQGDAQPREGLPDVPLGTVRKVRREGPAGRARDAERRKTYGEHGAHP